LLQLKRRCLRLLLRLHLCLLLLVGREPAPSLHDLLHHLSSREVPHESHPAGVAELKGGGDRCRASRASCQL
jgi:hypothetical protein